MSRTREVTCPACVVKFNTDPAAAGKVSVEEGNGAAVECPKCRTTFFPVWRQAMHVTLENQRDPAPAQIEPGDFAKKNANLIELQAWHLKIEELWRDEADEAQHAQRRADAGELADLARKFHDKAVAFYSKWEIRS